MCLFELCSFLDVLLRLDAIPHVCVCLSGDTRVSLFLVGKGPNCFWIVG